MVTNYYNSSNNYSSPVRQKEPKPYEMKCDGENQTKLKHPGKSDTFDRDKVLLLGLLAVLYLTECEDMWLLLAILYLALF